MRCHTPDLTITPGRALTPTKQRDTLQNTGANTMEALKNLIEEIFYEISKTVAEWDKPSRITTFGSRAKGNWSKRSDLDLLIIESFTGTINKRKEAAQSKGPL